MLDYNMLYKALHLSLNNHSADWNCCVIKQALTILDKQGLTYVMLLVINSACWVNLHVCCKKKFLSTVNVLKFPTLAACHKGLDKQGRP